MTRLRRCDPLPHFASGLAFARPRSSNQRIDQKQVSTRPGNGAVASTGSGKGRKTACSLRITGAGQTMKQTGPNRKPNLRWGARSHKTAAINVEDAILHLIC